jgi:hypothetical protein
MPQICQSPVYSIVSIFCSIYARSGLWYIPIVVTAVIYAIYFLLPLQTQRNKKTYLDKLEAQDQSEAQIQNLFGYVGQRIGGGVVVVFTWLVILAFTYNTVGQAIAQGQHQFLVTNTAPAMVVLRIYGDKMICAPFDRNKKEVKRSLVILEVAQDPDLVLSLEAVGPLSLENGIGSQTSTPTPTTIPTLVPTAPPTLTPTVKPTLTPVPTETPTSIPTPTPTPSPTVTPTSSSP